MSCPVFIWNLLCVLADRLCELYINSTPYDVEQAYIWQDLPASLVSGITYSVSAIPVFALMQRLTALNGRNGGGETGCFHGPLIDLFSLFSRLVRFVISALIQRLTTLG